MFKVRRGVMEYLRGRPDVEPEVYSRVIVKVCDIIVNKDEVFSE